MEMDKVNMGLDDIIKINRAGRGRGRGRGRRGASRGGFNLSNGRSMFVGQRRGTFGNPRGAGVSRGGIFKRSQQQNRNFLPRNIEGMWTHDLFEGTVANVRDEGKLLISNLEFGVNDNDMKELFSEFGQLKKAAVHYDFSGRSLGTAEVIFTSKRDAIRAMTQYNSVPLDGRPMKIQIVESSPVKSLQRRIGGTGRGRFGLRQTSGRVNVNSRLSGKFVVTGARRGRGRGRGRGGQRAATLTREQLDEQLESYTKMDVE